MIRFFFFVGSPNLRHHITFLTQYRIPDIWKLTVNLLFITSVALVAVWTFQLYLVQAKGACEGQSYRRNKWRDRLLDEARQNLHNNPKLPLMASPLCSSITSQKRVFFNIPAAPSCPKHTFLATHLAQFNGQVQSPARKPLPSKLSCIFAKKNPSVVSLILTDSFLLNCKFWCWSSLLSKISG